MKPTDVADTDETLAASSPADGSRGEAQKDKKIVIFINDVQFKFIDEAMTGSQLKTLAGISAANQLFADAPGHQDDPPSTRRRAVRVEEWPEVLRHAGRELRRAMSSASIEAEPGRGASTTLDRRDLPDGSVLVAADVDLPPGWNKARTRVRFLRLIAFPSANPDCFYADLDLRLTNGSMPQNTGLQCLDGEQLLWFSWHLSAWSPSTDNEFTYLRFRTKEVPRCQVKTGSRFRRTILPSGAVTCASCRTCGTACAPTSATTVTSTPPYSSVDSGNAKTR